MRQAHFYQLFLFLLFTGVLSVNGVETSANDLRNGTLVHPDTSHTIEIVPGMTVRILVRYKQSQPIFEFTSSDVSRRALLLSRGIDKAFTFEGVADHDRDNAINIILDLAREKGIISQGQQVLLLGRTSADFGDYFPNIFEVMGV